MSQGYPKTAAEQAARGIKWNLAIEPCSVAKGGGRSVGTAIAARSFIGLSASEAVTTTQLLHPVGRFTMKRAAAMGKGGCHLGSIYCVSQIGIAAKANLDLLESVAFTLSRLVGPWILGVIGTAPRTTSGRQGGSKRWEVSSARPKEPPATAKSTTSLSLPPPSPMTSTASTR